MTDSNTAVMDQPEVAAAPKTRLLTAQEFKNSLEYRLPKMTTKQVIGEVRRNCPMTAIGGGLEGLVLRIQEHHSFGADPYCLRGPKRSKIGRAK